jgi:hypothetical protein
MIYIQLDKGLFQNLPGEGFVIRLAATMEETTKLGEVDFEHFVVMSGRAAVQETEIKGDVTRSRQTSNQCGRSEVFSALWGLLPGKSSFFQ